MIIFESIKLALASIWSHKFRAFLTMLGIIIGISSVVTLISIGEGVKKEVKSLVTDIGSNLIIIVAGDIGLNQNQPGTSTGSAHTQFGNPANLVSADIFKAEDLDKIRKIGGVEYISPLTMVSGYVANGDKMATPVLAGVYPEIDKVMTGFSLDNGRFISPDEENNKKNVIVLGETPSEQLFGEENPVGKKVFINNQKNDYEFEVIGKLAKSKSSSMFSSEMDAMALIPYSTATTLFNNNTDKIYRIVVKANENVNVDDISKKINENMLIRHKKEEFSVMTQDDLLGMMDTVLNMLTAFVSAIAAISLVVGGVGIMNIMLVSVTERTREIGLRKAVGATNGAILWQFLIEAIILSVVGGLISLGLVKITTIIIAAKTDINPVITAQSVFLAIGVCVAIGIVFGLAPAVQASRKNPIDALRYE